MSLLCHVLELLCLCLLLSLFCLFCISDVVLKGHIHYYNKDLLVKERLWYSP